MSTSINKRLPEIRKIKFFSRSMRVSKRRLSKRHAFEERFAPYRCVERIRPFLLLFKSCGIFANEITGGRVRRCSWPYYGIAVFWVSVYVSYTCLLFYIFMSAHVFPIGITIIFAKHLIGYTSLSVNVLTAYCSQNKFGKFFDRLDGYDHEAARMGHKRQDNLWIPSIAMLSIAVVILSFAGIMMREPSTRTAGLFITLSETYTIVMQICGILEKFILLYLILDRFKHLNRKIAPNVTWDKKRRKPKAIDIADVKIMHSILCDAQETFNDIYRNDLLICFSSLMIHVLANIRVFREKSPLVSCAFVGPPIVQLLILCATCHYTAEEANKIVCVLIKNMTAFIPSGKTTTKIGVLTYFLHNRVSFDAAGFFIINLPLFQSIIAAITTYFIILI